MMRDFLILRILRNRKNKKTTKVSFAELHGLINSKNCGRFEVEIWTICKETNSNVVYNKSKGDYTFFPVEYCRLVEYFKVEE